MGHAPAPPRSPLPLPPFLRPGELLLPNSPTPSHGGGGGAGTPAAVAAAAVASAMRSPAWGGAASPNPWVHLLDDADAPSPSASPGLKPSFSSGRTTPAGGAGRSSRSRGGAGGCPPLPPSDSSNTYHTVRRHKHVSMPGSPPPLPGAEPLHAWLPDTLPLSPGFPRSSSDSRSPGPDLPGRPAADVSVTRHSHPTHAKRSSRQQGTTILQHASAMPSPRDASLSITARQHGAHDVHACLGLSAQRELLLALGLPVNGAAPSRAVRELSIAQRTPAMFECPVPDPLLPLPERAAAEEAAVQQGLATRTQAVTGTAPHVEPPPPPPPRLSLSARPSASLHHLSKAKVAPAEVCPRSEAVADLSSLEPSQSGASGGNGGRHSNGGSARPSPFAKLTSNNNGGSARPSPFANLTSNNNGGSARPSPFADLGGNGGSARPSPFAVPASNNGGSARASPFAILAGNNGGSARRANLSGNGGSARSSPLANLARALGHPRSSESSFAEQLPSSFISAPGDSGDGAPDDAGDAGGGAAVRKEEDGGAEGQKCKLSGSGAARRSDCGVALDNTTASVLSAVQSVPLLRLVSGGRGGRVGSGWGWRWRGLLCGGAGAVEGRTASFSQLDRPSSGGGGAAAAPAAAADGTAGSGRSGGAAEAGPGSIFGSRGGHRRRGSYDAAEGADEELGSKLAPAAAPLRFKRGSMPG